MQQVKVYISAKLDHAAKLAAFHVDGFHSNARWIEMAESGRKRMKPVTHWQQENFDDIQMAHFFLLYVEPGDILKGSLVETGFAIGRGKKCWIAGDGHGVDYIIKEMEAIAGPDGANMRVPHKGIFPWALYRQSIRIAISLDVAFSDMRAFVRPDTVMDMHGAMTPAPSF